MPNSDMMTFLIDNPRVAHVLFKPVQHRIIEKILKGEVLTDNEKRYLRGKLGKKIDALNDLFNGRDKVISSPHPILSTLENYYITGYEALKHNGFGWFYDTSTIIVMNTALKGSIRYDGKKFILIRTRSMKTRSRHRDPATGVFYASNDQIIRDAVEAKDESLVQTWMSMLEQYGSMFLESSEKLEVLLEKNKNKKKMGQLVARRGGKMNNEDEEKNPMIDHLMKYGV